MSLIKFNLRQANTKIFKNSQLHHHTTTVNRSNGFTNSKSKERFDLKRERELGTPTITRKTCLQTCSDRWLSDD